MQLSEQEGLVVLVTVLPANRVRPKRLYKKSHFVDCRITCLQPEFNARQLPTLGSVLPLAFVVGKYRGFFQDCEDRVDAGGSVYNGNRSAFRSSDDNAL